MPISSRRRRLFAVSAAVLTLSATLATQAEARRGGSFGSRGMRTYQPTRPGFGGGFGAAPVQRSMTPRTSSIGQQPGGAFGQAPGVQPRGGFLRRWGGPILGGLALGGLLGMLMGHGMGAGGLGFLSLLLQIGIVVMVVALVMRFIRSRRAAPAGAPAAASGFGASPGGFGASNGFGRSDFAPQPPPQPQGSPSAWGAAPAFPPPGFGAARADELGLGPSDVAMLERLFVEVQTAFGDEDYGALRARCTPEIMGFLAEELAQNATAGRRNSVRDVHVVQRDLAEAWREEGAEFASLALRFTSIDVVLDRASGALMDGDATHPTEAREVWTFVREPGGFGAAAWKVSAIQEAA